MPKYNTIDWSKESQYWKPGALADLRSIVHGRKKRGTTKHGVGGVHGHQFNRLASEARRDVWRHRGEMSGQR